MKMKLFAAAMAGLCIASATEAATVTYTLVQNSDATGAVVPGSFAVYGQTSTGDNSGLAAFQFGLNGNITYVENDSPLAVYSRSTAPKNRSVGFLLYVDSSSQASVRGAQDTASYDTNIAAQATNPNQAQTVNLVYGIGQTAGDVSTRSEPGGYTFNAGATANAGATTDYTAYKAMVLLASGTFTGAVPTLSYGNANVFTSQVAFGTSSSGTVQTIPTATLVNVDASATPEPASLAVLGLGGLGLMTRRRKTA